MGNPLLRIMQELIFAKLLGELNFAFSLGNIIFPRPYFARFFTETNDRSDRLSREEEIQNILSVRQSYFRGSYLFAKISRELHFENQHLWGSKKEFIFAN